MKHIIMGIIFINLMFFFNGDKLMAQTNITHVFNRLEFEAFVQYTIENGEIIEDSQLWGSSPCLKMNNFYITLLPKFSNHNELLEYFDKTHYNVSDFNGISIVHFMGITTADITLIGDNVYITHIINARADYNELFDILINTCIPQIKELIVKPYPQ